MQEELKKEPTLVENIQEELLKIIKNGGYQTNDVLPKESELAEKLGVSRVVIREALSSLRALGFIETKKKKGTVLVSPQPFDILQLIISSGTLDNESIRDLYDIRLMLEIGLADFIFDKREDKYLQELHRLVDEEDECIDPERLRELDVEFHSILYKMANSPSLAKFQSLVSRIFMLYPQRPSNWKKIEFVTHRALLRILETGNPDSFRAAMRLHLTYQFENREKNLESFFEANRVQNRK